MLGDSALIFGKYQTSAAVYYDSLSSIYSCDSIVSWQLIVNPPQTFQLPAAIVCTGDSALIFGEYQNTTAVYYDSLSTVFNCDSVVSQELNSQASPNVSAT